MQFSDLLILNISHWTFWSLIFLSAVQLHATPAKKRHILASVKPDFLPPVNAIVMQPLLLQ